MWPVLFQPREVCAELGACHVKSPAVESTCDDCIGLLGAVATTIGTPEKIEWITEFLKVTHVTKYSEYCYATNYSLIRNI